MLYKRNPHHVSKQTHGVFYINKAKMARKRQKNSVSESSVKFLLIEG